MSCIVVGLSGGVDSSVAALLLKQQGHDVIGIYMRNWNDASVTINNECPWVDDSTDAQLIADQIGIPFQTLDFSEDYKSRIVNYMFREYEAGRTPNPDVLCNREIKFDLFLKAAQLLNADFVATGHYCRKDEIVKDGKIHYRLLSGADGNKDQSYFLCQLTPEQLAFAMFPIGHLQKAEVRAIAAKNNLITADKKDSQGLCFVGKVRLPEFLQQQLKPKQGDVFEVDANMEQYRILKAPLPPLTPESLHHLCKPYSYSIADAVRIGHHQGAHFYTVGQRKGLGIGGQRIPLFIVHTDTTANQIFVGSGHDFPGLYRRGLFIPKDKVHWVRRDSTLSPGNEAEFSVRVRYRQPLATAKLIALEGGVYIVFTNPMWGVTPGQFAAWYDGDELIGSGVIEG
jgi:tRNA-specific 2-thiouridylase